MLYEELFWLDLDQYTICNVRDGMIVQVEAH